MSDAFLCDFCHEYEDGEPEEQLYRRDTNRSTSGNFEKVADLCGTCAGPVLSCGTLDESPKEMDPDDLPADA